MANQKLRWSYDQTNWTVINNATRPAVISGLQPNTEVFVQVYEDGAFSPAKSVLTRSGSGNVYYSSSLGWSAGQDITSELGQLLSNTLQQNDTLILEEMFVLTGQNMQLPDGFTIIGNGGGFDVTNSGENNQTVLLLGNGNRLYNLTVRHSNSPQTGYIGNNPVSGVDYHSKITIRCDQKSDCVLQNCKFEGNVSAFCDVRGCSGFAIVSCHFDGTAYQIRTLNNTAGLVVESSLFENALVDGLKTIRGDDGSFTSQASVRNCVFVRGRDGIDMTGGFRDSVIVGTIFLRTRVSGIDVKSVANNLSQIENQVNSNILVDRCEFIDTDNAIVFTVEDNMNNPTLLTSQQYNDFAPNNMIIRNSIFERTPAKQLDMNAVLIKDAHNITWQMTLLGNINGVVTLDKTPGSGAHGTEWPVGWTPHSNSGSTSFGDSRAVDPSYPFNSVGPI